MRQDHGAAVLLTSNQVMKLAAPDLDPSGLVLGDRPSSVKDSGGEIQLGDLRSGVEDERLELAIIAMSRVAGQMEEADTVADHDQTRRDRATVPTSNHDPIVPADRPGRGDEPAGLQMARMKGMRGSSGPRFVITCTPRRAS